MSKPYARSRPSALTYDNDNLIGDWLDLPKFLDDVDVCLSVRRTFPWEAIACTDSFSGLSRSS